MDSQSPNALSRSLRVVGQPALGIDRGVQVCPAERLGCLVGLLPGPPDRIDVQGEARVGIGQCCDVTLHAGIDPRGAGLHVRRLGGQPLHQVVTRLGGDRRQLVQCRPWAFGVDVVGGERRYAAPVVDACADQGQAIVAGHQVGGSLDAHLGSEHQPGHGDRRDEVVDAGVGGRRHRRVVLGPEVLHDHFLNVAELLVGAPDRVQCLGAFGQRFTDSDQQAGGERNGQPPGVGERAQPNLGILVRAAVVGQALGLEQPPRGGLQHHPHRGGDRLEPRQLRPCHHAGIQVWQQTGLFENADRHRPHVVQRRVVAALVEPLASLVPPRLGAVTEGEKRFLATQFGSPAGDVEDLVGLHVHAEAL